MRCLTFLITGSVLLIPRPVAAQEADQLFSDHSIALFLAILLLLLFLAAFWCRRQVRRQTHLLEEQNRRLEDELLERQQIETELRERQQQYQVLFEDSHTIMLLLDPLTAAIVDANPAASRFYQYPRESMRGMKISRLNELSEDNVRQKIGLVERCEQQQFQFQHRLADGQLRDVEVYSSPIVVEGRSLLCSIIHDITERKLTERQLETRHDFLQAVIDGVSDPLMVIAPDHRIIQMNKAAFDQLPEALKEHTELTCHLASHASLVPCNGQDHPCSLIKVQETGAAVTLVHRHQSKDGERIIELKASPLFNPDTSLRAVVEVARDITERMQTQELLSENEKRLHHLAHHDPLTSLPNRLLFEDRIKQALSKARRTGKQVALFFLDLDHFKDVNDNLGHDVGDLLLIDVADRLRSCVREHDTVARMGGDEFLVLLEEIDSLEMVETMAERICKALVHELSRDNYYQRVSASIGISLFPNDGATGKELLKTADLAMYRAKNLGKNTYQFYSTYQTGFLFE